MHELSLCGSIADIVSRRRGSRRVLAIHLRVGALRQVVPDTLEYCWSLVSADTDLEGSVLEVEHIPLMLACRSCGASTEVRDVPVLACGTCASVEVDVTSGEELLITALDLMEA